MSELDDIKARAAEFLVSPYWTNYLKLDTDPTVSAIEGLLTDLDRAIAIAEHTEWVNETGGRLVQERDEARAAYNAVSNERDECAEELARVRAAALALREAMVQSGSRSVVDAYEPLRVALADTEWLEQYRD